SHNLEDGLRITEDREAEPGRGQTLDSWPVRAQNWLAAEVGRDHPALVQGHRQWILDSGGVTTPIEEGLPGLGCRGDRHHLIERIHISTRIQPQLAVATDQHSQSRLA